MILTNYFEKICSIDFEVLQSYWLLGVRVLGGETYEIHSYDEDIYNKIIELKRRTLLYGYNIKGYDLKILAAIELGASTEDIYLLSQWIIYDTTIKDIQRTPAYKKLTDIEQLDIINHQQEEFGIKNKEVKFKSVTYFGKYNYTDLMDDVKGMSLKQHMANMGMEILEATEIFEKELLEEDDFEQLLYYNKNDTLGAEKFLMKRLKYIETKVNIALQFNIPVVEGVKYTDAQLVAKILHAQKKYQPYNAELKFKENVDTILRKYIPEPFYSRYLNLKSTNNKFTLFRNEVVFGVGGIHSSLGDDLIMYADNDHELLLLDYTSFYTTVVKYFNYHSRNISQIDINNFNTIHDTRLLWKTRPELADEKKLNTYKDLLNIYTGALRQPFSALYDLQMGDSLCRTGQLILTAFANAMYNEGMSIIQTNTDGIVVKVHKSKLNKLKEIINEFKQLIDGQIGITYISKFIQDNVNNYILQTTNKKIKAKGNFVRQVHFNEETGGDKNLLAPVVHKAIMEYFINNIPVEDTINKCDSLFDFCIVVKHGSTYNMTVHGYKNQYYKQQKVNRCIATNNTDYTTLYKIKSKTGNWEKLANVPDNAYIVNKALDTYDINKLDLNKQWYIDRAKRKVEGFKVV